MVLASASARGAGLTPTEERWLQAVWPVVEQAQAARLPLDITVQPQDAPGMSPLAMAFVGGRCKLVLTLRGNPMAAAQTQRIEATLGRDAAWFDAALALMAAHEIHGHCARHAAGRWHAVPPGYVDTPPAALDPTLRADYMHMRATRREEAYADLAALAWARSALPDRAGALYAWLLAERSQGVPEGSHHDTLAWIRNPRAARLEASAVDGVWAAVLLGDVQAARAP
jgi:hypothetical protein